MLTTTLTLLLYLQRSDNRHPSSAIMRLCRSHIRLLLGKDNTEHFVEIVEGECYLDRSASAGDPYNLPGRNCGGGSYI